MRIENTKTGKRQKLAFFENVGEFVDYAKENALPNSSTMEHEIEEEFDGGADFAGAVALSRSGWSAGLAAAESTFEAINAACQDMTPTRDYRRDVVGDFYDLGAVAAGIPECAFVPDFELTSKVYRIALNFSKSGSVSGQSIINLGVAAVALIDKLQAGGATVELDLVACGTGDGMKYQTAIIVPVDCRSLDTDQLMFCLAHPAFLRRIKFVANEILTGDCYAASSTRPAPVASYPTLSGRYDLVIDSYATGDGMSEFKTVESSIEWINRKIEQLEN